MNIPKAYIGGFQKAIKLPRMLFIIYFANFFTALILALTFKGVIEESFGQSGILSTLIKDFDFTTFTNLMFDHGDAIGAVIGGIKWLIIAYFLMSIFLTGGIIETFNKDKFTTSSFFGGAAYNFFRFLGLSLVMILVQFIFLFIVYIPLSMILKSVSENMTPEVTLYYIAISGFVFHLLIFLFISMIGDYAKFYLVLNDSFNVFKGFWNGVKYVFGNFLRTYILYLILLFLPAVIMYLYLYLERDIKMATGVGILIVFGMQQAFMILRVFVRTWILSSEFKLYNADFVPPISQQAIVLTVIDTKTNTEKEIVEQPTKIVVKEPVKQETTKVAEETKQEVKTEYAIDFSKTFTSADEEDTSGEKIITEEEMLKKVNEEQATKIEDNIVPADKTNINKEENIQPTIETVQQNVINVEDESGADANKEAIITPINKSVQQNVINVEDESGADDNEKEPDDNANQDDSEADDSEDNSDADDNKSEVVAPNIETIQQNVINAEDESGVETGKDEIIQPNIETVQQNVINVDDESGVDDSKEKDKKSDKGIIEFE